MANTSIPEMTRAPPAAGHRTRFGRQWKIQERIGEQMADLDRRDVVIIATQKGSLRGVDLSRVDLSRLDLRKMNLSHADLSGCNLTDADLTECDFTGATLRGATLNGATLRRAKFTGADLER